MWAVLGAPSSLTIIPISQSDDSSGTWTPVDSALITMEDQWGAAGEAEDIVVALTPACQCGIFTGTKSNWEAGSRSGGN